MPKLKTRYDGDGLLLCKKLELRVSNAGGVHRQQQALRQ